MSAASPHNELPNPDPDAGPMAALEAVRYDD
jgi:hypothetical protein